MEQQTMSSKEKEELIRVVHEWDRVMVENDAAAIGQYMADDWTIIGSDGRVDGKATFLALVRSRRIRLFESSFSSSCSVFIVP